MAKVLVTCIVYLLTTLLGMTLIKLGHDREALFLFSKLGIGLSFMSLVGVIFYGISFLLFIFGISKLNVSIVIPVVSGIYCMFTVFLGMMIFNEQINRGQIAGIGMVIMGTILIGINR